MTDNYLAHIKQYVIDEIGSLDRPVEEIRNPVFGYLRDALLYIDELRSGKWTRG